MSKMDRVVVVLLVCLLLGWSYFGRQFMPEPDPQPDPAVEGPAAGVLDEDVAVPRLADGEVPAVVVPGDAAEQDAVQPDRPPEVLVAVSNEVIEAVFTSHGGGIASVSLFAYAAAIDERDVPLVLDFGSVPALSYEGLSGISSRDAFDLQRLADRPGVRITAETDQVFFERLIVLGEGYSLTVEDRVTNRSDEDLALTELLVNTGEMQLQESGPGMRGMTYLGVDFLRSEDQRVEHTGKRLRGYFGIGGGCGSPDLRHVPFVAEEMFEEPMQWVAVKNKFFTQILEPGTGIATLQVQVQREETDTFQLSSVRATLALPPVFLPAGETFLNEQHYYAGPKKYTLLRSEGDRRADIMEFGRFFKWVCQLLLPLLNAIERIVPGGYGVAVILLTVVVKLVFWPVTHKGTESMKRMQKLQPELKKLREKYKKDPKKLQEKQMLLYREHKVNPLAGCLPMVIQIPVFIGLFTVLRSAVELRYARFLWIADLSEPEGILAGVLPFPAGGLNILPLLMTATMVLQQRLTPSAGDPQQQKMMAFMPIMMLFIFYNMPSALVLYWTVSQLLSILQLYLQQRRDRLQPVAA